MSLDEATLQMKQRFRQQLTGTRPTKHRLLRLLINHWKAKAHPWRYPKCAHSERSQEGHAAIVAPTAERVVRLEG
jgi:hypothetical protein